MLKQLKMEKLADRGTYTRLVMLYTISYELAAIKKGETDQFHHSYSHATCTHSQIKYHHAEHKFDNSFSRVQSKTGTTFH